MEQGDRLQYACGHWLVAGEFGIQDAHAQGIVRERCGDCKRRLHAAAPALLEALERLLGFVNTQGMSSARLIETIDAEAQARIAIESTKGASN